MSLHGLIVHQDPEIGRNIGVAPRCTAGRDAVMCGCNGPTEEASDEVGFTGKNPRCVLELEVVFEQRPRRSLGSGQSKLQKRLWVSSLAMSLLRRGSLDCRNIMFKAELHRWEIGSPEKEHKL